jgi:hypothetical protein
VGALVSLCVEGVSGNGLSLGLGPSLHRLDGRYPRLRQLLPVLWPRPTPQRLFRGVSLVAFPRLPTITTDGETPSGSPSFQTNDSLNVPNSLDPGRTRPPRPFYGGAVAFAVVERLSSCSDANFGARSLQPIHTSLYASPREVTHAAQGDGLPWMDSFRGRTCSICKLLLILLTCCHSPAAGLHQRRMSCGRRRRPIESPIPC